MAKIKNISGDDRLVPALGYRLVIADAVVDVDDSSVDAYVCQPTIWQAVDRVAQAAVAEQPAPPVEASTESVAA